MKTTNQGPSIAKSFTMTSKSTLFSMTLISALSIFAVCPSWAQTQKTSTLTVGQELHKSLKNPEFRGLWNGTVGKYGNRPESFQTIKDELQQFEAELERSNTAEKFKSIQEGGVGSGGGTGYRGGLLDLALYNQGAFNDQTPGEKLPETRAYKLVGYDRLNNQSSSIVQKALNQISKWRASSPAMAPRIAQALKKMPLYYASGVIQGKAVAAHLPAGTSIQESELSVLGIYVRTFGNFTSKKKFEALSEKNQIAYLIHESLRHLQISQSSLMTNEVVQKLTAFIMRDPQEGETLDTRKFMEGEILAKATHTQRYMVDILSFANESCVNLGIQCDASKIEISVEYADQLRKMADQMQDDRKEKIDQKEISLSYIKEDVRKELNLRHGVSLIILRVMADLFYDPEMEEAAFSVGRGLKLWPLDSALTEIDKNFFYKNSYAELLKNVQSELVKAGLMQTKN